MLVDTHCHLHLMDSYPGSRDEIVKAAHQAGVMQFLNVATSLDEVPALTEIAKMDGFYISAGVHPNEAPGVVIAREALVAAASYPKVIAIGETGLDYYRQDPDSDLSWQRDRFAMHIDVAKALHKPLIVHTRHAPEDTLRVMRTEDATKAGGIMHCFTENWAVAQQALDLGFYISFSGIVTFKSAHEIQEVALKAPLDRILVETDCPYLAPVPFRGKPNQPAYVRYTAEFIAELRGMPFEELAAATTANFHRLFSLA